MHDRVNSPVEESVLGLESADPEPAREVVPPAALVRPGEAPQACVLVGGVALAAPFGPGHPQQVGHVPLGPGGTTG